MRAIVYTRGGDAGEVLCLAERPVPEPGAGEVRVRILVSGVNPTDWKARQSADATGTGREHVPNQDGAGIIDAVGEGVEPGRVGRRVWVWEAAWQRSDGTAQEYVVLPERQAVDLPADASLELGASLGIPALTAHRALTVAALSPERLAPGALTGRRILVAGGAGAVGNAAIQLARWAGAQVVTTVSSPAKAILAKAAGAQYVVDYRAEDPAAAIRRAVPEGVDLVVEVAPAADAALDLAVLAPDGAVVFYADDPDERLSLPTRDLMLKSQAWYGMLVYTVPETPKTHAVAAVNAAVADGALCVGKQAGLPLHHYPLERTADAHDAVAANAVGKVLINVAPR